MWQVQSRYKEDLFTMRLVKHWHRWPREVVDASFLETFEVRMDRTLSSLIYLAMSLFTAGIWIRCFGDPFQHKPFCDSMNVQCLSLTYSHHLKSKHNLQVASSPLEPSPYIYLYAVWKLSFSSNQNWRK